MSRLLIRAAAGLLAAVLACAGGAAALADEAVAEDGPFTETPVVEPTPEEPVEEPTVEEPVDEPPVEEEPEDVVPLAPLYLSATAASGAATLSWQAPEPNAGSPVTGYEIEASTGVDTWLTEPGALGAGTTSHTLSGLTNGITYLLRVRAVNAAGSGAWSEIVAVTPVDHPSAPDAVAAAAGVASLTVSWRRPASDGGSALTGFIVQYSLDAKTWKTASQTVAPSATTFKVTGLASGTRYYVRVLARNAAGTSPASAAATTSTWAKPTAPRTASATPGKSSIIVRWTAPSSTGGTALTAYTVQYSTNGATWTTASGAVKPSATSYTISGLKNGTSYYVRVIAGNPVGSSPASARVSATPRTVQSAPRSAKVTPGNATITVRWAAPSSSGGATRTAYIVQYSTNGTTWKTASSKVKPSATSYAITGLKNGTRYYVRVIAVNAAGQSAPSTRVSTTPRTVPSKPRVTAAATATGRVTISWSAPSNGGAPITGYVIQRYSGGKWRTVATVSASSRSKTFTGLTVGSAYKYRVAAKNAAGTGGSTALTITAKRCHSAYSGACVPIASDVDCAGGSGNGPAYVRGPVYIRVRGVDPYALDRDRDGVACEP